METDLDFWDCFGRKTSSYNGINIPHIIFIDTCIYFSVTRICVLGTADGWFLKLTTKVHIDQVIEGFAQNCPYMSRLEIQWDPDTIRFSDKSNKFVDHIR